LAGVAFDLIKKKKQHSGITREEAKKQKRENKNLHGD